MSPGSGWCWCLTPPPKQLLVPSVVLHCFVLLQPRHSLSEHPHVLQSSITRLHCAIIGTWACESRPTLSSKVHSECSPEPWGHFSITYNSLSFYRSKTILGSTKTFWTWVKIQNSLECINYQALVLMSPSDFIFRNHRQKITITRRSLGLNQNILILAQICFGSIEGQGINLLQCLLVIVILAKAFSSTFSLF